MITAFFGMLLISVWYVSRADAFTLSSVVVTGGETVSHEEITTLVKNELSGAYLKFVPKTFVFTYPHEAIVTSILAHPKIKSVEVTPRGRTELRVDFKEFTPHALWCSPIEATTCFYLDETGFAFAAAPKLEGGALLRLVSIGRNPEADITPFSVEHYTLVQDLATRLAEARWYPDLIEIDGAGDAYFSLVGGGEFKISLTQPADETMSNLSTILGSEQFAHIKPGNFEYIDLRFGSKVFVNEVIVETTASTTATTTDSIPEAIAEAEEVVAELLSTATTTEE